MDKEINPLLAFGIVLMFLVPVGIWTWAAGEVDKTQVGSFYLEQDASGNLSLQVGPLLITQRTLNQDANVFDLTALGFSGLMGNIAYLPDDDFLVRASGNDWSLASVFSLAEYSDPQKEALGELVGRLSQDQSILVKCNRTRQSCVPYLGLSVSLRHRLYVEPGSDNLLVSEGLSHTIKRFNSNGQITGYLDSGLKYPKRIRAYQDHYYLVDTNHHRVVFIDGSDEEFGRQRSELIVAPDASRHQWTIDAVFFAGDWWAVNADGGMQNPVLHRFDSNGQFIEEVVLAKNAQPFDLLVWNDSLLVSDISAGNIYRITSEGLEISTIESEAVKQYFNAVSNKKVQIDNIIFYAQMSFVLLLIAGLVIAFRISKKHDKEQSKEESFGPIPDYLHQNFRLYKPNTNNICAKEIVVNNILVSNIEIVPDKRIKKHIGLVQGSTVRAKHAGKDFMAGLKNIFGGELNSYTDLLSESRQEALDRMTEQARAIGANAVINVRFSTSSITAGASEILAYGTAVLLEDK